MRLGILVMALAALAAIVGHGVAAPAEAKQKITIGIVAKAQSNPVFQAAHGARDAAKELAEKYGVEIELNIQTPPDEDAKRQALAVEQLARAGAQGIAVSCSDANTLTTAIDKAVDAGAAVICFDSDAPKSKRFACFGTDDISCGAKVAVELAKAMGDKGNIAILGGNQTAPNLRNRIKGVKDEIAANHPNMKIVDVFFHEETAEKAAAAVQAAQSAHPEIQGWAMIGGWPLFTKDALKWEPGTVKVVSVDALPAQLGYVKSGHVQMLLAQDCYGWGYESVRILLDKIVKGQNPKDAKGQDLKDGRIIDPLKQVTKDNVEEFGKNWEKWLKK